MKRYYNKGIVIRTIKNISALLLATLVGVALVLSALWLTSAPTAQADVPTSYSQSSYATSEQEQENEYAAELEAETEETEDEAEGVVYSQSSYSTYSQSSYSYSQSSYYSESAYCVDLWCMGEAEQTCENGAYCYEDEQMGLECCYNGAGEFVGCS